jgi:hypothetical protein
MTIRKRIRLRIGAWIRGGVVSVDGGYFFGKKLTRGTVELRSVFLNFMTKAHTGGKTYRWRAIFFKNCKDLCVRENVLVGILQRFSV